MEKKIVISRYNEDVSWVKHLDFKYTIYNKGEDDIPEPNIKLPNLGREAQTYLNFIISNYHTLDDSCGYFFLQGSPFDHLVVFENINDKHFRDFESFGGFSFNETTKGPVNYNFPSGLPILEFCNILFNNNPFPDGHVRFKLGAQFCVTGKVIRNRCIEFYKFINDRLLKKNPIEGHILERIWHVIFNVNIEDRFTNYHKKRNDCLQGANWQGTIE